MEFLTLIGLVFFLFLLGMAKVKGTDIYLEVNTGTEEAQSFAQVGGQKDATFDRGLGTMDVTDKQSGGDEEHLPANRNWGVSFDAFLIEDNPGFQEIEDAYNADPPTQLQYQIITPGYTYMGKATIESLSISAPEGEASVAAFTLKGTGPLTKTP